MNRTASKARACVCVCVQERERESEQAVVYIEVCDGDANLHHLQGTSKLLGKFGKFIYLDTKWNHQKKNINTMEKHKRCQKGS